MKLPLVPKSVSAKMRPADKKFAAPAPGESVQTPQSHADDYGAGLRASSVAGWKEPHVTAAHTYCTTGDPTRRTSVKP